MVRPSATMLRDLLAFEPEHGRILLKGYRMVLLSAAALGCLRRELIATVGVDEARGLMKRFGHAAGMQDGAALAERFPASTPDEHMALGPSLHALEGVARVVRDEKASVIDLDAGRYRVEAYWENSFEAEQHLERIGRSDSPVCWTLSGYATGHSTRAAGRPTVVVETRCRAMGHDRCRFVVGFADEMVDEAQRESADYAPHDLPEMLSDLLHTIETQKRTLRSRDRAISKLRSRIAAEDERPRLLGSSDALRDALDLARQVSAVDTTVLIVGESGTGKELLARAVHDDSSRAERPFVAINCSALPESLQEAELFGFARGAFTGAVSDSAGLFEAADGGTLFLDEIGDLALPAQTKILRALQEGEIKRLGETTLRRVDVRVVAATHRDLRGMIDERSFRDDLYYRLSVVTLELPPLRDRGDDVLVLAEHFVDRYARKFDRSIRGLTRAAKCALAAYPWPGNVRELENAIQRGVILCKGTEIELDDLPEAVVRGAAPGRTGRLPAPRPVDAATSAGSLAAIGDEAERIRRALSIADGNRERAAVMLGISRTTLWRRMRKLDVEPATD